VKNNIEKKIKKKLDLSKKIIIQQPLNVLKRINLNKFKKITSFSLSEKIEKFKENRKKLKENKIISLKKEKIKKVKVI
jgi:hypothetical protein